MNAEEARLEPVEMVSGGTDIFFCATSAQAEMPVPPVLNLLFLIVPFPRSSCGEIGGQLHLPPWIV
jgi:hypothetical protein